ncbi:MAG TPA: PAS domain-containing sensor histidine kinase, partial [Candidatus Thermoplasmatota archaeon]|nr:PAS domain-containing sensor histidine kinase [Candidatus Thermoplasmatota archaeon]
GSQGRDLVYRWRAAGPPGFDYLSPAIVEFSGQEAADFYADPELVFRVVHPEDAPLLRSLLGLSVPVSGPAVVRWQHKDGRTMWSEVNQSAVFSANGDLVAVEGIARDVTDRERDRETERRTETQRRREGDRLRENEAFQTKVVHTAARELGSPLTAMGVQVHLLRQRAGVMPQEATHAVDVLARNLDRLTDLVRNILDVTQLRRGVLPMRRQPVEIDRVIAETLASFREDATRRGITIESAIAEDLVVVGDVSRLTRAFFHLVGNAVKFTPADGHVTVQASRRGDTVVVRIKDTGPGIRLEDVPHLFQPFAPLDQAVQSSLAGAGVGLYLTRGLVEEHGGRVWVESAGAGQGSTFVVTLPLAPAGTLVHREARPEAAPAPEDRPLDPAF